MKNLVIIMLCLISLSASFSLFPSVPLFPSLSLPTVPLYPSSLVSVVMKDPAKELSKIYCSLTNTRKVRACMAENNQQKSVSLSRKCLQSVKSLKTMGELSEFYCKKMNPEESVKAQACLNAVILNMIATDPTYLPTVLNCLFKVKKSEE